MKLASSRQDFCWDLMLKIKGGAGLVEEGECDLSKHEHDLK